ncbi:MAG: phosphotransferase [Bauldia sp.]
MSQDGTEIPLAGGRVTTGVVRVGDTVRRPQTANSGFVARLLDHLAAQGFRGAPIALGIDDRDRDIFSYIEGAVPPDLGFHGDAVLRSAATLIRRFHDLTAGFVTSAEVICHNDLSPCNFVFREGVPVAIIDFDAAAPGSRDHDLGYAAWLWLDIGNDEIPPVEQRRRLRLFADAYGADDHGALVAAMMHRQEALIGSGVRNGDEGLRRWASDCLAWTRRHGTVLAAAD